MRAELIDGTLYDMAPPSGTHQLISGNLVADIIAYIRRNNGACRVFPAPYGVFLDDDDRTYVEPDISVVCDQDKLDESGCHGAPDWVIEIVSPASRAMDYFVKLVKYREAGVREYWIVDPLKKSVRVYRFDQDDDTEDYSFDENVPVGLYPGFSLRVGDYMLP